MRLNNVMKKILAAGLAATMVMANAGVSFADYSVAGGKTPFSKYLIMDEKICEEIDINFHKLSLF